MPKGVPAKDFELGYRSGQLEIVELLPDHFNPSNKRYQRVRVRCDCGYTYAVNAVRLQKNTRCWY